MADLTLDRSAKSASWRWHTAKHVTQMARSLSTLFYFFFFFFFFSLFCGLRNATFSEGEVRVDINEPATGLTQDRVVLSQGSQMRCRVVPGMDRLR
jgi:hypothetical protein